MGRRGSRGNSPARSGRSSRNRGRIFRLEDATGPADARRTSQAHRKWAVGEVAPAEERRTRGNGTARGVGAWRGRAVEDRSARRRPVGEAAGGSVGNGQRRRARTVGTGGNVGSGKRRRRWKPSGGSVGNGRSTSEAGRGGRVTEEGRDLRPWADRSAWTSGRVAAAPMGYGRTTAPATSHRGPGRSGPDG